jgi:hypothetical protein
VASIELVTKTITKKSTVHCCSRCMGFEGTPARVVQHVNQCQSPAVVEDVTGTVVAQCVARAKKSCAKIAVVPNDQIRFVAAVWDAAHKEGLFLKRLHQSDFTYMLDVEQGLLRLAARRHANSTFVCVPFFYFLFFAGPCLSY